jgi:hypothetical protein
MPPEIVYGKKHSREVDIWALGVLLYELIHGKLVLTAGRAPYSAETIEEVQEKMKITEYVFKKTLSKEAKDLLLKILKHDPKQRITLEQIFQHPFVLKHLDEFENNKDAYKYIPPEPEWDEDLDLLPPPASSNPASQRAFEDEITSDPIKQQDYIRKMLTESNINIADVEKVFFIRDEKGVLKMRLQMKDRPLPKRGNSERKNTISNPLNIAEKLHKISNTDIMTHSPEKVAPASASKEPKPESVAPSQVQEQKKEITSITKETPKDSLNPPATRTNILSSPQPASNLIPPSSTNTLNSSPMPTPEKLQAKESKPIAPLPEEKLTQKTTTLTSVPNPPATISKPAPETNINTSTKVDVTPEKPPKPAPMDYYALEYKLGTGGPSSSAQNPKLQESSVPQQQQLPTTQNWSYQNSSQQHPSNPQNMNMTNQSYPSYQGATNISMDKPPFPQEAFKNLSGGFSQQNQKDDYQKNNFNPPNYHQHPPTPTTGNTQPNYSFGYNQQASNTQTNQPQFPSYNAQGPQFFNQPNDNKQNSSYQQPQSFHGSTQPSSNLTPSVSTNNQVASFSVEPSQMSSMVRSSSPTRSNTSNLNQSSSANTGPTLHKNKSYYYNNSNQQNYEVIGQQQTNQNQPPQSLQQSQYTGAQQTNLPQSQTLQTTTPQPSAAKEKTYTNPLADSPIHPPQFNPYARQETPIKDANSAAGMSQSSANQGSSQPAIRLVSVRSKEQYLPRIGGTTSEESQGGKPATNNTVDSASNTSTPTQGGALVGPGSYNFSNYPTFNNSFIQQQSSQNQSNMGSFIQQPSIPMPQTTNFTPYPGQKQLQPPSSWSQHHQGQQTGHSSQYPSSTHTPLNQSPMQYNQNSPSMNPAVSPFAQQHNYQPPTQNYNQPSTDKTTSDYDTFQRTNNMQPQSKDFQKGLLRNNAFQMSQPNLFSQQTTSGNTATFGTNEEAINRYSVDNQDPHLPYFNSPTDPFADQQKARREETFSEKIQNSQQGPQRLALNDVQNRQVLASLPEGFQKDPDGVYRQKSSAATRDNSISRTLDDKNRRPGADLPSYKPLFKPPLKREGEEIKPAMRILGNVQVEQPSAVEKLTTTLNNLTSNIYDQNSRSGITGDKASSTYTIQKQDGYKLREPLPASDTTKKMLFVAAKRSPDDKTDTYTSPELNSSLERFQHTQNYRGVVGSAEFTSDSNRIGTSYPSRQTDNQNHITIEDQSFSSFANNTSLNQDDSRLGIGGDKARSGLKLKQDNKTQAATNREKTNYNNTMMNIFGKKITNDSPVENSKEAIRDGDRINKVINSNDLSSLSKDSQNKKTMATLTTEVKKSAAIVLSSNQQQLGLASTAFGPSQSFSDRTLPSTLIQNKPPEVKVGSAGQTDNISLLKSTTDLRFAPTIIRLENQSNLQDITQKYTQSSSSVLQQIKPFMTPTLGPDNPLQRSLIRKSNEDDASIQKTITVDNRDARQKTEPSDTATKTAIYSKTDELSQGVIYRPQIIKSSEANPEIYNVHSITSNINDRSKSHTFGRREPINAFKNATTYVQPIPEVKPSSPLERSTSISSNMGFSNTLTNLNAMHQQQDSQAAQPAPRSSNTTYTTPASPSIMIGQTLKPTYMTISGNPPMRTIEANPTSSGQRLSNYGLQPANTITNQAGPSTSANYGQNSDSQRINVQSKTDRDSKEPGSYSFTAPSTPQVASAFTPVSTMLRSDASYPTSATFINRPGAIGSLGSSQPGSTTVNDGNNSANQTSTTNTYTSPNIGSTSAQNQLGSTGTRPYGFIAPSLASTAPQSFTASNTGGSNPTPSSRYSGSMGMVLSQTSNTITITSQPSDPKNTANADRTQVTTTTTTSTQLQMSSPSIQGQSVTIKSQKDSTSILTTKP